MGSRFREYLLENQNEASTEMKYKKDTEPWIIQHFHF